MDNTNQTIAIVNLTGKLLVPLYTSIATWKGTLNRTGHNKYLITEGTDIIALIEMVDESEKFNREYKNAITITPTHTLFLFQEKGVVIRGDHVIYVDENGPAVHHSTSVQELASIRNHLLGDSSKLTPRPLNDNEMVICNYFKNR